VASPEALLDLSRCCDIPLEMTAFDEPQKIASRRQALISLELKKASVLPHFSAADEAQTPLNEHLRRHCKHLHKTALARLHLQMALYVHPVVRGDELTISKGASTLPKPDAPRVAEAELRSVYTMFIKAMISPRISDDPDANEALFKTLGSIMHVTSRELDRYSGQLRQFIVDDKGMYRHEIFSLKMNPISLNFHNMLTL
jgi:hypothetical protein